MILDYHQYRFFKQPSNSETMDRFIKLVPQAKTLLIGGTQLHRRWITDQEMFCHEMGHLIDLVDRGDESRLFIENFGWPRVSQEKWPLTSAINECRVFTYQWLLQEELGYTVTAGILRPGKTAIFLEGTVRKEVNQQFFLEQFNKLKEELEPDWKELLHKTINHIVSAIEQEHAKD
jgi:hypothetical protein